MKYDCYRKKNLISVCSPRKYLDSILYKHSVLWHESFTLNVRASLQQKVYQLYVLLQINPPLPGKVCVHCRIVL